MALVRETARLAKALESIPTLPTVAHRLNDVIQSSSATVPQVAEILRSDPATSAKLLRLVNSPHFGVPGGVADVARAIPFVGFSTLYQLVLSISVLDVLNLGADHDPRLLWTHSLTAATAARELAEEIRFSDPGACFTAGLLHDMGKIALAKIEPDKLGKVFASMRDDGMSMADAEVKHGLAEHDRIGSRLAKQWRFPATLATPIEQHHAIHRVEVREKVPPNLRMITEIVCAADHVSMQCTGAFVDGCPTEDGDPHTSTLFERNGFSQAQIQALVDTTKTQLERSKVFLSLLDGK
jgi:putative nucleotidyltransferase with HDIG domain